MSEVKPDARVERLIEVVERDRDQRIQQALDDADTQIEALLSKARRKARRSVRRAIREASTREQRRIEDARAELVTRTRRLAQHTSVDLLERAWAKLTPALTNAWDDPSTRAQWVDNAVHLAVRELPRARWCIEHPRDFDPTTVTTRIEEATGHRPDLRPCEDLRSGLRFVVEGITLDASPTGLLAEVTQVQSKLLAHLLPQRDDLRHGGRRR